MNPQEQWARVAQLLAVATETPASLREGWLEALDDPPEIKADLRQMLDAWSEAGKQGFLDEPALSRPLSDDKLGTVAGSYTLIRRIGSGGVGEVYLGYNEDAPQGHQVVAVKLLHRRFAHADDVLAAFAREHTFLRGLQHSALVPALASGVTPDGLPYLVFEYVEGVPIDLFCNHRRAGLQQRLNLFRQLCDAVAYLHQRQVLHLDLKPSNVLVTPQGEVKLLDLGLARLLSEAPGDESHFVSPGYSSPEQVCGGTLRAGSDLYSLGAVLYVLLTGRQPLNVDGASQQELRRMVKRKPPLASAVICSPQPADCNFRWPVPPGEWQTMLRGPLDQLLATLLQRSPRRRVHSAAALSARVFVVQQQIITRQSQRRRHGMHRLVSTGLLLFGVVLLTVAAAQGWEAYLGYQEIRTLAGIQQRSSAEFHRLRHSPAAQQALVAQQAATLQRTYQSTLPRLLKTHAAPRRQIAAYAQDSMALLAEMEPVAGRRGDLAHANADLLHSIAKFEQDELHDEGAARWARHSARLLYGAADRCCSR